MIRVYDDAGNVIEKHEHKGDLKELSGVFVSPEQRRRGMGAALGEPLPEVVVLQGGEGDRTRRDPDNDGRSGMVGRDADWDEQIWACGHVERLAVWCDGEGESLRRDRNGGARRVCGHTDRRHGVAARVEDIERPSVRRDGHVEGLVAHWDCGQGCVARGADWRHGVVVSVGDIRHLPVWGDDDR